MATIAIPPLKSQPKGSAPELTPELVLEKCIGSSNVPEENDELQKLIAGIRSAIDAGYTRFAYGSRVLSSQTEDVVFENGPDSIEVHAWYGQCLVDFYPLHWLIARKPASPQS